MSMCSKDAHKITKGRFAHIHFFKFACCVSKLCGVFLTIYQYRSIFLVCKLLYYILYVLYCVIYCMWQEVADVQTGFGTLRNCVK
jgi:hypothetical protein